MQNKKIMKTQIILRTVLVAVALFVTFTNNGSNIVPGEHISSNSAISYLLKNEDQKTEKIQSAPFSLTCNFCIEHSSPAVPEPEGDHEFHSFHFKHNEKRVLFWKNVANKIVTAVYYLVVLIVYICVPQKLFS